MINPTLAIYFAVLLIFAFSTATGLFLGLKSIKLI